ncbi:MAG: hypothetical protein U5N85_19240 [Arcicella sp.]|nr:hypothetical protein [Arcicella sp.]
MQDQEQITFSQPASSVTNMLNSTYGVVTPIMSLASLTNGGLELRSNLSDIVNSNTPSSFGSNVLVTWNFPTPITSLTISHTGVSRGTSVGLTNYNGTIIGGDFTFSTLNCNYTLDTDGDGIVNTLDLDSDGDGCSDAIEGDATFTTTNVDASTMPGGNSGTGYTGTSTSPVTQNLGITVGITATTLGVPTVAGTGQTVGTSQNKTTFDANCITCVAGTIAPNITPTTATNTCPATTVSLAGLANAGIKPAGTTLIWSTHKVPTSAADTLTNLTTVSTAGNYYALYFDKVNNCYSPADSVQVTITTCPSIPTTLTNTCPAITVDLMAHVDSTNKPAGTYVSWHSGTPATAANKVANPTAVGTSGTYYVCFADVVDACYGGTSTGLVVTITPCTAPCLAGTTAPDITPTTATNTCPTTTVSLAGLANAGIKPAGTTLIWSTHKVPTSAADTLTNLTTVSTAGNYYALYFDKVNNCYSPADSVTVSFVICAVNPSPQVATVNEPKAGTASTDLTPTGGTGPYVYSVDITASCVIPSGGTALPSTSNLTVTNSATGAYTYTTPATAGTYYFCIKVCDTTTPTANCLTKTYTLTVTAPPCLAGTTAPIIPSTAVNTCPTTTVDFTGLNTGTKPAGTSLVWSTNKVPTSAADTLTNLTTVSTAGKYYALYFDKVNNCYSPADSITISLSSCVPVCTGVVATTDLTTHIQAGTPPAGETFEWHNALPISASNIENNPSAVVPGMYYAVYNKGGSPVCYSNPTPIRVITNTCPATTIDLRTAVDSTSKPTGYVVTFHTGIPATGANRITGTDITAAATGATYYTAYCNYDIATASYCYSGTSVIVVVDKCCVACVAGTTAPDITPTTTTNTCPTTTVSLAGLANPVHKTSRNYFGLEYPQSTNLSG